MRHLLLIIFAALPFNYALSQPSFHLNELKRMVNPYESAVPDYLQQSIPSDHDATRELIFKPLYEQYDYYDLLEHEWIPSYKFEYDYHPDASLNILNEFSLDLLVGDWINTRRTTYAYDLFGFQSSGLEQVFDPSSGGLINNTLYEEQHTTTGDLLQEKISYWNAIATSWLANHKHDYTYYANGKELSVTHSDWVDTSMLWYTYSQYISTYDNNENLLLYKGIVWNEDSVAWLNETEDTMVYNSLNQLIHSESKIWSIENQEWIVYYGYDYEYDDFANLIRITSSTWDNNNSVFQNLNQYLYEFDNNKLTKIIFQLWDNSSASWQNFNMNAFFYDASGFPGQKIISNWTGTGWVSTYQYLYTNDDHGNVIQSIGQTWNNNFQVWNNVERYTVNWLSVITSIPIKTTIENNVLISPNPVADYFIIAGLNLSDSYNAAITDMKGITVSNISIHGSQPVFVKNLPAGNYLVTIKENSRNVVAALPFLIVK
ncbi:MAG: T9SS type A sorting domain-containing protein [Chitinophagaceae bacterium]|nr:T9SS type A sorting domain-containing protein [Chitinophagaceae bacterium]